MASNKLVKAALAAVVTAGLAVGVVSTAQAGSKDKKAEKCYGVAKKGMNDCQASAHACAGQSKKDAAGKEWVYLPKGTCDKLVGGSTAPKKDS